MNESKKETNPTIPPDDLARSLKLVRPDTDTDLPHIGLLADTYTIVLTGNDTEGHFCLIDMFVPVGGGPPPHRHDFEETFVVIEGEIHARFRGKEQVVRTGETIHVPSNAPHQFQNRSDRPARMLCICSPAGQDEFFMKLGTRVTSRTAAPPKLGEAGQRDLLQKVQELAPRYRTELLQHERQL
jgi:quercetin dioxygenase-like cupin family protein